MDFNLGRGYKSATLFKWGMRISPAERNREMDKEFLRLMDSIAELIPQQETKLEDDHLICECFCVSAGDIRQLCIDKVDLDLVQTEFNLGHSCGTCLKNKNSWINKIF